MTIQFDLSEDIRRALSTHGADLDRVAKEALLVELYREGRLFHSELAAGGLLPQN